MTQGGPGNATLTLVYQIFLNGFTYLRMGYASALSFVLFAILFVITIVQVQIADEVGPLCVIHRRAPRA